MGLNFENACPNRLPSPPHTETQVANKATPANNFTLPKPKKGNVAAPAAIKVRPSVMPAITPISVLVLSSVKRDLSDVCFKGATPSGRSPKIKSNTRPT